MHEITKKYNFQYICQRQTDLLPLFHNILIKCIYFSQNVHPFSSIYLHVHR